jgi:hypothetical protein
MISLLPQAFVLAVLSAIGATAALVIARRVGFFRFRVLLIASYTGINLVSGIAHLFNSQNQDRSVRVYFDAVNSLDADQLDWTIVIAGIGLFALCAGAFIGLPAKPLGPRRPAPLPAYDRAMIPVLLLVITPISLIALVRIREYAATLDVFGGRIISTSGGFARYAFLTNWAVWAVSLFIIWYAYTRWGMRANSTTAALLLLAGGVAIAAVLSWSGGRALAIVMTVPVVLVVLPLLRLSRFSLILFGSAVALIYMVRIQVLTSGRLSNSRLTSGPAEWLDWEWGRFSMLGFAVQHKEVYGALGGETVVNGLARFVDGFARLAGAGPTEYDSRMAMEVAGEYLLNSSSAIYVVPGLVSEMYMNFGSLGVVFGMGGLGLLCGWVDAKVEASQTAVIQLFWAFVGAITVYSVGLDSGFPLPNIVWTGFPLIVAACLSYLSYRRATTGVDYATRQEFVGANPR